MSLLIDQVVTAFIARCQVAQATGGVFEDRGTPFTKAEANAINVSLKDATAQTLGDNSPVRSVLQVVLQIDMSIYTRAALDASGNSASCRQLSGPIWRAAHAALMLDPSLGGLAMRTRWVRSAWQSQDADGEAGWATHTYECKCAMREVDLSQP
jgi:hypothetical protein